MRVSIPCRLRSSQLLRLNCTSTLRQVSLTFFTKETCLLCIKADKVLSGVLDAEDLQNVPLKKVDIMDPANSKAFDKYCYDVPVLHVDRPGQAKPVKFMHYFDAEKIAEELRAEKL